MNDLRLRYVVDDASVSLRPIIDGVDLLSDSRNSTGLEPDALLPPVSSVLFPTRAGRSIDLGACSCGEVGCGSLRITVRRQKDVAVWEPAERFPDETISRTYRFNLIDYLDAIDAAAGDRPGEGRGRRVARMVEVQMGRKDQRVPRLKSLMGVSVDWVTAWPWSTDKVRASVSSIAGQEIIEYGPRPHESDERYAERIVEDLLSRIFTEIRRRRAEGLG
jgi:hypothetical protein